MSKRSLVFKISSIITLAVDIAFVVFCAIEITKVITKYTLLTKVHFIVFIITLSINACYFLYIISTLIYNKLRS